MSPTQSPSRAILVAVAHILAIPLSFGATSAVFEEDFSTSTVLSKSRPYIGGWFGDQLAFGTWTGGYEATISSEALLIQTTSTFRSAAIAFDASTLTSAGQYTLTFDLSGYQGSSNNSALVKIYGAQGYGASNTGNALVVNTQDGVVETKGSATSQLLSSMTLQAAALTQTMTFEYSGTGAIILFFGAQTTGWPFPTVTYDNISLSPVASRTPAFAEPGPAPNTSVPEPLTLLHTLPALAIFLIRRRRAGH